MLALCSLTQTVAAPQSAPAWPLRQPALTDHERLEKGEIIVGLRDKGATKYVTGTVLIDQPPDKVWPIMVNPFEFKGKISPRMKTVEVVLDKIDESVLKVSLDLTFLIPNFTYVVRSLYDHDKKMIEFQRVGGSLKDFSGTWEMASADGGKKTELTYCMYVDPGFFVPQWIVREGVKVELPKTLTALRRRVNAVATETETLETQTILAAAPKKKMAAGHHVQ